MMIGYPGRFFLAALCTLAPFASHAMTVTIEPDDYAIGTDLSNISPFVTLQKMEVWMGAVTPSGSVFSEAVSGGGGFNPPAPTGDQTFGNYGYGYGFGTAFGLMFHTAVSNVSLLANSYYWPGVPTTWAAFDASGNRLAVGSLGRDVPAGESFQVEVNVENMAMLVLGADDGGNTTRFDRLTFEVDDRYATVPEPRSWMLLGAGVMGVMLMRRRVVRGLRN